MTAYPEFIKTGIGHRFRSFLHILLFMMAVATFSSCSKNQFEVTAQLSSSVNSTYRMVWHASSSHQSMLLEGILSVTKGEGKLICATRFPTIVYVYQGSATAPTVMFYARKGDKITIKGDSDDPASWSIGGNDLNEEWSKWRLTHKEILKRDDVAAINKEVAVYVNKHPDSEFSTVLLLAYYSRRENEEEFNALWKKLTDDARSDNLCDALMRADLLQGDPQPVSALTRLVLRSSKGGYDTLVPAKSNGMLLYFTGNTTPSGNAVDTLKSLRKQYSDSVCPIVEVFVVPDSLAWRRHIAEDSTLNIRRCWTPLSLADSTLMRLPVPRSSFFIVVDGKGQHKYRGDSPVKAAESFRSIKKSK